MKSDDRDSDPTCGQLATAAELRDVQRALDGVATIFRTPIRYDRSTDQPVSDAELLDHIERALDRKGITEVNERQAWQQALRTVAKLSADQTERKEH